MRGLPNDTIVTLDVSVIYDDDEIVRPLIFTASELGGLVGCVIELVNKFREGHDIENTIVALGETLQMLEHENDVLSLPPIESDSDSAATP